MVVYSVQWLFILSSGCLFCPERDAVERHPGFNPATRLTLSSGSSKRTVAAADDPELEEIEEILQECSSSPSKELPKPLPRPPASAKKKGGAKSAAADDDDAAAGGFNLFGFDAMEASASASGEQQVFSPPPFLRMFLVYVHMFCYWSMLSIVTCVFTYPFETKVSGAFSPQTVLISFGCDYLNHCEEFQIFKFFLITF